MRWREWIIPAFLLSSMQRISFTKSKWIGGWVGYTATARLSWLQPTSVLMIDNTSMNSFLVFRTVLFFCFWPNKMYVECVCILCMWVMTFLASGVCWWLEKGWGPVDVFSTGWMKSSFKISVPITLHGMYFPSTPLTSTPSFHLSQKDMVGWC